MKPFHHLHEAHHHFKMRRRKNSFFNSLLIVIAIVLVWRGIWWLADMYLLPKYFVRSHIVWLLVGILLLYEDDKKIDELSGE